MRFVARASANNPSARSTRLSPVERDEPELFELYVPSDAGGSYLGAYTIKNEWVAWLIGRAPELVAEPVSQTSQAEQPPACQKLMDGWRKCRQPMVLRPGYWTCFRHGEPVRLKILPTYDRAPAGDVLSLLTTESGGS